VELAAKLQVKPGQRVLVLGAPEACQLTLAGTAAAAAAGAADVLVAFAADSAGLEAVRADVAAAGRRDALCWVAYPKGGRLGTDLSREAVAAALRTRTDRAGAPDRPR